jgi:hypothetical protein
MKAHSDKQIIAKARHLTVPPNEYPDPGMEIEVELNDPTVTYKVWFYKSKVAGTLGWKVLKIDVVK